MAELTNKKCQVCADGTPPLSTQQEDKLLVQVPDWEVERAAIHRVKRDFSFADFREALAFVNQVGELAEQEGHHPEISLHHYRRVLIELYTHKVQGLSESDFIMAAKISQVFERLVSKKSA